MITFYDHLVEERHNEPTLMWFDPDQMYSVVMKNQNIQDHGMEMQRWVMENCNYTVFAFKHIVVVPPSADAIHEYKKILEKQQQKKEEKKNQYKQYQKKYDDLIKEQIQLEEFTDQYRGWFTVKPPEWYEKINRLKDIDREIQDVREQVDQFKVISDQTSQIEYLWHRRSSWGFDIGAPQPINRYCTKLYFFDQGDSIAFTLQFQK